MARPAGVRNQDYDHKRAVLLGTLTEHALSAALTRPSLRQFAIAAHQSEPTLRHYFGDRQGLVIEIISELAVRAATDWKVMTEPAADQTGAVRDFMAHANSIVVQERFAHAHAFGLIEGLADESVGQAYLERMLEPSLKVFSIKLQSTPGGPQDADLLRASTLAATAPLFMLAVHQVLLGGTRAVPINMDRTLSHLQDLLVHAFETPPEQDLPMRKTA